MSPITHGLIGWLTAEAGCKNRRDRALVTAAGLVPDLDGAGIIAELLTRDSEQPLLWWTEYHHVLGHNLVAALAYAAAAAALARDRARVAGLALVAFHLHLVGDIVGSKGPEGYAWPVPYLAPFSDLEITWSGQWALNAWPNMLITALCLFATFYLGWRRGHTVLGLVWPRGDGVLVQTLRARFGEPAQGS